ncbi:hypothetical protein F4561_001190 [Lipingzhangella halophila]|uniref:Uncharacterized protein n=1 Tax=Lipingzhangella halophila TaxID=1783352 RepID=A0A7W7RE93_9ACTN|nr:hypothetical protein [Lipingzhangella halophila]
MRLRERLTNTSEDLSEAARLIEVCLKLLERAYALYLRCSEEQRRMLNQAIFHGLYVVEDPLDPDGGSVTGHALKEPFARLHAVQKAAEHTVGEMGARHSHPRRQRVIHRPTTQQGPSPFGEGPCCVRCRGRTARR